MGNPTSYRPAYCELVAAFPTLAAFAAHIGVPSRTVRAWHGRHPEFKAAVTTAARFRPTLYRIAYCDQVVECLKEGYSLAAFAGQIGVTRQTLYDWIKKRPEFAEAVKRAQAKAALWWERRLLDLAQTGQGNSNAIILGLKNRAADEWRDKTHTELAGRVEQVHRIERTIVRPEHSDG